MAQKRPISRNKIGFWVLCKPFLNVSNSCQAYINIYIFLIGKLHSQDYQEFNWMFIIGEVFKIVIVMDVTTQNIKREIKYMIIQSYQL